MLGRSEEVPAARVTMAHQQVHADADGDRRQSEEHGGWDTHGQQDACERERTDGHQEAAAKRGVHSGLSLAK